MTQDSLPELLVDHGIRLKSFAPGREEKLTCPRCHGGKSREDSLSVRVDDDGMGAVWQCHRGHCGWRSGVRMGSPDRGEWRAPPREERVTRQPMPHAEAQRTRDGEMYGWFQDRGIGPETVDHFGCYVMTKGFRSRGEDGEERWTDKRAIVFPYLFGGRLVNRKYRSPQKELMQDPQPLPTLFNVDALRPDEAVIWVEGEPDVMALHESGFLQAVSLKDGSGQELRAENDPRRQNDKRFAALATHADLLNKADRFILAGDMDQPGLALREELARRLGRHRCWIVNWPEGCKDAGDVLEHHGPEAVRAAIGGAKPYPIKGVHRIGPGDLVALRNRGRPPLLTTGTDATDAILKLPGEGRIIIITGIPNHGKSSWALFVKMHVLRNHDRRFVVFSPEMEPWEEFVAQGAAVLHRRPFWPTPGYEAMTDEQLNDAEDYLNPRIAMLVSDPEEKDQAPTLEWIIELARLEVLRSGATDLLIDPWNELEHQRGELSETEYIGRSLQRLRAFARRHGVNVWIVAHPTKQFPAKPGEQLQPPNLYSINGSANWNNKADLGLTVHTVNGTTQIHITKSRFRRWGQRGDMAELTFEVPTGVYSGAPTPVGDEDP